MPKKTTLPLTTGKHAGNKPDSPKSKAFIPQKYTLNCAVKESHGHPIYCVSYSRHLHVMDRGKAACFATCGGPYATIYEDFTPSDEGRKINGGTQSQPLSARQIYRDVDDGETFYSCAFGGRGVGSPVQYNHVGVVEGGDGDNVIYFGDNENRQKTQHNPKRRAKRQKQSKAQNSAKLCTKTMHTSFLLPFSDTQDGPPLLCLAGTRGIIKVIDTYRRSLFMTLSGHGNDITDLKFSPTNEWLLLSSSKDESVRLWNLQRGVNVAVFTGHNGHRGQVLSVAWHLSGTKFASCGMDNMVKLWRVYDEDKESGKRGPVETALRKSFCAMTPNDSCHEKEEEDNLGVGEEKRFDTIFHQFPYFSTNKAHINYVDCVQFVGDLILSKSVENKVVLWKPLVHNEKDNKRTTYSTKDVPSSILFLREFKLDNCDSWYIRFESQSPHHHLLALGNQIGEVKVWKIGGDEEDDSGCHPSEKYFCNLTTTLGWLGGGAAQYDQSTVRMVAFNPHGSNLVAVKDDATVWMWNAI